jgi:hypothetical protein
MAQRLNFGLFQKADPTDFTNLLHRQQCSLLGGSNFTVSAAPATNAEVDMRFVTSPNTHFRDSKFSGNLQPELE